MLNGRKKILYVNDVLGGISRITFQMGVPTLPHKKMLDAIEILAGPWRRWCAESLAPSHGLDESIREKAKSPALMNRGGASCCWFCAEWARLKSCPYADRLVRARAAGGRSGLLFMATSWVALLAREW